MYDDHYVLANSRGTQATQKFTQATFEMSKDKDDDLDELLRHWDRVRTPSHDDLQDLTLRIQNRLSEEPSILEFATTRGLSIKSKGVLFAIVAIAAVVICAVSVQYDPPPENTSAISNRPSPSHFAAMSPDELSAKERLLSEMRRLFDEQLASVVELDDDVRIDVSPDAASSDSPFLAIRMVLLSRESDDRPWQLVWKVDALARDQGVLEIKRRQRSDELISMWTYMLPDGKFAVDIDARLESGKRLQSHGSHVLQPRRPGPVVFAQHHGTQYCVFQSVAALESDAT